MSRRTPQSKPNNEKNDVYAWGSINLGLPPFKMDDIFREPSKELLDNTIWNYLPFSTYDLCRLDRIQAICNNSPTTSGIIQQKVNYFLGDGFYAVPNSSMSIVSSSTAIKKEAADITDLQLQTLNEWLSVITPEGENIEEVSLKIGKDFSSFGNAFIELQRIKVGQTKKYYVRPLPITWCRPRKAAANEMYPSYIGVSSEFEESYEVTPANVVDLPIFPRFDKINGVEKSIIHLKNYEPTLVYWGIPDWVSAKIWAELEYRIPKYNQSKFENGFTPSAIISLFGSANAEEARKVVQAMKDCFTGTGNNSKMFIQALRDPTYKSDVQILDNKSEGEFMDLQNLAQQNIIAAHRWSVSLTGLRTAGSLGSNQQIRSEFDIVYNTVIRPMQRLYLSKFLNPIIQDAGKYLGYDWSNIALDIAKPMPVSFAGDIPVDKVLTINEMRSELGWQPIQETIEEIKHDTNDNIN
jgi:capsid portal protein